MFVHLYFVHVAVMVDGVVVKVHETLHSRKFPAHEQYLPYGIWFSNVSGRRVASKTRGAAESKSKQVNDDII